MVYLARRGLACLEQIGCRLQGSNRCAYLGEYSGCCGAVGSGRFKLQNGKTLPYVSKYVDIHAACRRPYHAEKVRLASKLDTCRPDHRLQADAEEIAQRRSKRWASGGQHAVRIAGRLQDDLRDRVNDEKDPVGLD